jgi:hypothetical protein
MMLDWNVYSAELSVRAKEMSKLAPNAVAGFIALNAGAALTYSARVLDAYAAIDGAAKSVA